MVRGRLLSALFLFHVISYLFLFLYFWPCLIFPSLEILLTAVLGPVCCLVDEAANIGAQDLAAIDVHTFAPLSSESYTQNPSSFFWFLFPLLMQRFSSSRHSLRPFLISSLDSLSDPFSPSPPHDGHFFIFSSISPFLLPCTSPPSILWIADYVLLTSCFIHFPVTLLGVCIWLLYSIYRNSYCYFYGYYYRSSFANCVLFVPRAPGDLRPSVVLPTSAQSPS